MSGVDSQLSAEPLTEREVAILQMLDEGLSDREIAARLVMTVGTIKWYNRQIYSKLGVASRTQAVHRARELALLQRAAPPTPPVPPGPPALRSTLPGETTRFIGRTRELQTARQLLRAARLLTLTGSPGSGKTRLALRLAADVQAEFADGACFVNLAPLAYADFVVPAMAEALGVAERPGQPLDQTLRAALGPRELLLVLDNFEHLLPAAPQVAELLLAAPRLKILVTSREPLHLHGEQEYPVPPLALPDAQAGDAAALAQSEAVALFVQRAQAVYPTFSLTGANAREVAHICLRLDGLPLAVELAAGQSKLLSPRAILDRLAHPLAALVNGARDLPARQQTLHRTLDWSYDLLDAGERQLFARLGVFAAGWTLDAMQAICGEGLPLDPFDGLAALVNKSLVYQRGLEGEPRFDMLAVLREFAVEKLAASGELETIRRRHAAYFADLAERVDYVLNGTEQRAGLDHLELEHDNFRAVLGWAQAADLEPGLRVIAALSLCWQMRGYLLEGYRWSQRLLASGQVSDPRVRAKALYNASVLAHRLGDDHQSEQFGQESLGLARQTHEPLTVAWSLYALGAALIRPPLTAAAGHQAHASLDEAVALFRAQDSPVGVTKCLASKGEAYRLQGALAQAALCYGEAVALDIRLGNPGGWSANLSNLGWVALRLGLYAQAEAYFRDSQQLARQIRYPSLLVGTLAGLAGVAAHADHLDQAVRLFGVVEAQQAVYRDALTAADWVDYAPCVAVARAASDPAVFARWWAEGQALTLDQALASLTNAA